MSEQEEQQRLSPYEKKLVYKAVKNYLINECGLSKERVQKLAVEELHNQNFLEELAAMIIHKYTDKWTRKGSHVSALIEGAIDKAAREYVDKNYTFQLAVTRK